MSARIFALVAASSLLGLAVACSSSDGAAPSASAPPASSAGDDAGGDDGGTGVGARDGGASDATTSADGSLPFTCSPPPTSNPCPAPTAGKATFCLRPQWAGVTSVDVLGGFGQASDWTAPFLVLTNDGSGTFVGTATLPSGEYPYVFRTHGSADGLVKDNQILLDQLNPQFAAPPPQAPLQRSVSLMTVPQTTAPVQHVRGHVVYAGAAQGCYSVDLEAGELRTDAGALVSEHTTANFTESAADGSFDFPVANGPFGVVVRFPFALEAPDGGYPSPGSVPSIGYARTSLSVAGADVVLDPVDVSYPAADYAAMTPSASTATLPVTFGFTIVPGASSASVAVISTHIPGNDPAYWSAFGTTTSISWDGTFGGKGGKAMTGVTYWWGTWQMRVGAGGTKWSEESMLAPITFH